MSDRAIDSDVASFAQADLILLVAGHVAAAPCRETFQPDFSREELAALASAAGDTVESPLLAALTSMFDERRGTDPSVWQSERTRLFEGPVACPINETGYIRRDKGAILADICGFYRAFGFEPDATSGEKADHLVCELEFVGLLLVMLGEAQRLGDAEKVDVVRSAVRTFLADHLGEWLGLFCGRLAGATDLPLCARSVDLLHAVWDVLARRFDLPPFASLSDTIAETAPEDDGTPYECDMAQAEEREQTVSLTGPPGSGLPQAD
jgi:nitrate reductase assembly molybdenum cofactor insertion protein NarJ